MHNALQIDLYQDSFETFCMDKLQKSPIGKRLAEHNNIKEKLQHAGINTRIAFNYNQVETFCYEGNSTTSLA